MAKALVEMKSEYAVLSEALKATSAAATDPGSKAESKYDTRSLEMSYLAAGQAQQADLMREGIDQLERLKLPEFSMTDAIELGALVEVVKDGEWVSYLLLPVGGGVEIEEEGVRITTLTIESPLFEELKGKKIGESLADGSVVSEVS